MNTTNISACVEIAYSKRKGRTLNTSVVTCNDGALLVTSDAGEVTLRAVAYDMLTAPESGRAYVVMTRENAEHLCRNLAARLGLEVTGRTAWAGG